MRPRRRGIRRDPSGPAVLRGGLVMGAPMTADLASRLDSVLEEAQGRVKAFQSGAERQHQELRERFQKFLPVADRITAMAREKLERLRERLAFEVTPAHSQTDQYYARSVTLDVKSELAGVVKLNFRLGHNREVTRVMLDYELEIIPVFFQFNSHGHLDFPLEAYDEAGVSRWLDDRIVDFANAYLEMHLTKQYQDRALVCDPVAGITFPKYYAACTLDHGGTTYHFVSDVTRREFAKRHGLTP
jgi:YHS domain-containing protein